MGGSFGFEARREDRKDDGRIFTSKKIYIYIYSNCGLDLKGLFLVGSNFEVHNVRWYMFMKNIYIVQNMSLSLRWVLRKRPKPRQMSSINETEVLQKAVATMALRRPVRGP